MGIIYRVAIGCSFIMAAVFGLQAGCEKAPEKAESPRTEIRNPEIAAAWQNAVAGLGTRPSLDGERVPLGRIDVQEDTPAGEWLEIGGDTPLLWCYRGGRKLVFEQDGPKVYLAVDDKPFSLVGVIVRSKDDMQLADALAGRSGHGLTLWIYSPHLSLLSYITAIDSVDSIQVWEWYSGLLTDLSPVAAAKNLTSLNVRDCRKLADISPLQKLTKLSSLDLRRTDVSEYKPLAALPLTWLDVRSGKPAEPSVVMPLAQIKGLLTLKVQASTHGGAAMPLDQILPKLPNLQALTVDYATQEGREGRPFKSIGASPKLSSLFLDGLGGKADFSSLGLLKGLTTLKIVGCMDKLDMDLSPLPRLGTLQVLRIEVRKTGASSDESFSLDLEGSLDLTPLRDLSRLEVLEIVSASETAGHKALGALPNLRQFVLNSIGDVDVPQFIHPEKLRLVDLSAPKHSSGRPFLRNVDNLSELKNLESLSLRECGIKDLSAVGNLKELRRLDLSNTNPLDLTPLKNLTNLEVLLLRYYRIHPDYSGLQPLAGLEHLKELDLTQSHAERSRQFDLSHIAGLKQLQRLELDQADVKDGLIPELPSLTSVSLPRNITTESFDAFVEGHPDLVRLKVRGGGTMFPEPLKADISSVRRLRNLTDIYIECKSLDIFSDMKRLTRVCLIIDMKKQIEINLDSAATRNLTNLRYLILGICQKVQVPSTWTNIFVIDMFTLGLEPEMTGLPKDMGVFLFPGMRDGDF